LKLRTSSLKCSCVLTLPPAVAAIAGTPLGDPIEAYAALAVFCSGSGSSNGNGTGRKRAAGDAGGSTRQQQQQQQQRSLPISLTALKSHMGHAEPAAGVLGMCRALSQLSGQWSSPLLQVLF
jgi:acyl transferase domain-containing protein